MNKHIVSDEEFASVTELPGGDRYRHFIKRVVDYQVVWSIADEDGWSLAEAEDGAWCVPAWPAERYADACCTGTWKRANPRPVPLDDWLRKWTPGVVRDGRRVAVFPTPDDRGVVVAAGQLAEDLVEELSSFDYESSD